MPAVQSKSLPLRFTIIWSHHLLLMQAATCQFSDELQRLKAQRELREVNLDALPLADADLRKLDASVKRNTALIKKLRSVSEESRAALLDDISRTNQSKVGTCSFTSASMEALPAGGPC